jgi:hypothetical protein
MKATEVARLVTGCIRRAISQSAVKARELASWSAEVVREATTFKGLVKHVIQVAIIHMLKDLALSSWHVALSLGHWFF